MDIVVKFGLNNLGELVEEKQKNQEIGIEFM